MYSRKGGKMKKGEKNIKKIFEELQNLLILIQQCCDIIFFTLDYLNKKINSNKKGVKKYD